MKAIETKYKGYRFRSRLEARWAVFWDHLRITWEYEKEGYSFAGHSYLPDFYLPEYELFVEIKGVNLSELPGESEKLEAFASYIHRPLLIACGLPAEKGDFYYYSTRRGTYTCCSCVKNGHPLSGPHNWEPQCWTSEISISAALEWAFLEKYGIGPEDLMLYVDIPRGSMKGTRHEIGGYEAARSARFEHGENGTI